MVSKKLMKLMQSSLVLSTSIIIHIIHYHTSYHAIAKPAQVFDAFCLVPILDIVHRNHLFSKQWQVMLATGWILPSFNGHSQGSIAFLEDWQGQVVGKLMDFFKWGIRHLRWHSWKGNFDLRFQCRCICMIWIDLGLRILFVSRR